MGRPTVTLMGSERITRGVINVEPMPRKRYIVLTLSCWHERKRSRPGERHDAKQHNDPTEGREHGGCLEEQGDPHL